MARRECDGDVRRTRSRIGVGQSAVSPLNRMSKFWKNHSNTSAGQQLEEWAKWPTGGRVLRPGRHELPAAADSPLAPRCVSHHGGFSMAATNAHATGGIWEVHDISPVPNSMVSTARCRSFAGAGRVDATGSHLPCSTQHRFRYPRIRDHFFVPLT